MAGDFLFELLDGRDVLVDDRLVDQGPEGFGGLQCGTMADLGGANIKGQIDMSGANFDRTLDADSLQVGEVLLMGSEGENKTSFKDADLGGAKIRGPINMTGASFDCKLNANRLQVEGDLLMRSDSLCGSAGR